MKPTLLVALCALGALAACARPDAPMPPLVGPAWLAAHLHDADLVLLHVGDEAAYRARHIPGARRVTLDDVSVSTATEGAGLVLEVPPAAELRTKLTALGISDGSRVVVYFGEDWISPATRVLFTLDVAGLGAHAALLDGGMPAWVKAGNAVTDAVTPAAKPGTLAPLTLRPLVVSASTVVASLGKPGVAVVDARDRAFYDGTKVGGMPDHPHRAGHIRGALSVPYDSVFEADGALRDDAALAAIFARAGVKQGDTVIGYCHIGQQATAMLFAARRLGHPVELYDGAFEDWSYFHPAYPVDGPAAEGAAAAAAPVPR
jgi:thiosulfate/3-mercaptopyruvate sulfurtransferase